METRCEDCMNYALDTELDEYYCTINLDEDEYSRLMGDSSYRCPFFRIGDDYTIVRKQN